MNPERNIFFITGLPRSRTAWLANYLTWGDCFCFHDPLRTATAPGDLAEIARESLPTNIATVGFADPALLFFQDALIALFPQAQWFVIDHEPLHALRAARVAFGGSTFDAATYARKIADLDAKVSPLHLPLGGLNRCALEIGHRATYGHFDMPQQRHEMLCRLQVQILPDLLRREIAAGPTTDILQHIEP